MQIQLHNIQLLDYYKQTYPDAEILFEGRNLNVKQVIEQIPDNAPVKEEVVEEVVDKQDKNNNKKIK